MTLIETAAAPRRSVFRQQGKMEDVVTDRDPLLTAEDARSENDPTQDDEEEVVDDWSNRLVKIQLGANAVAHVLSGLSVVVVIRWISMLGGLSWEAGKAKQVFNWHPLLMISAFCFMTVASLSFRYPRVVARSKLKWTHGMAWTVSILCALIALIAVLKSHNDASSGFIANLYSLHSWIGCAVTIMYLGQFLVGILTFVWPLDFMTPRIKARTLQVHRFLGRFIYNCAAIVILLGIQEKEGFVGCAYKVDKADMFPPQHFFDIPLSCRISHSLGILVVVVTLCTNMALHDFGKASASSQRSV